MRPFDLIIAAFFSVSVHAAVLLAVSGWGGSGLVSVQSGSGDAFPGVITVAIAGAREVREPAVEAPPIAPQGEIRLNTPPAPHPDQLAARRARAGVPVVKSEGTQALPGAELDPSVRAGGRPGAAAPLLASGILAPEYPEASRRLGEEGRALFRVTAGPGDDHLSIALLNSAGYRRLDDAARRALEGAPIEAFGSGEIDRTVAFVFRLDEHR